MRKLSTFLQQSKPSQQMEKMKQFAPDEFDLIIIDEAHHAAAKNYQSLLNYFKPQFWLGMTATPERMDNQDVFSFLIITWRTKFGCKMP